MRLALHTVICCCVFTLVLPLVQDATGELNSSLKKRFKVWLQSRMKRDLHSSLGTDENAKMISPPSRFGLNSRPRRSSSSRSSKPFGCILPTCVYHDLLDLLYKINKEKETKAPESKIGSKGYGRRRRSLLDVAQLPLQTRREGRSTGAPPLT
uniref:Adrenomedullin n=1 Tax=Monopterus albus TaxID=43700 RepID=A0A3Q3JDR9_MONAL